MPHWAPRVEAFCAKTYELVSFLVDVLKVREGRGARSTAR